MSEKIFIVAGNFHQFIYYRNKKLDAAANGEEVIKASNYVYVSSPDTIRGHRPVHGFYIGTYYERPDIDQIKLNIALANR